MENRSEAPLSDSERGASEPGVHADSPDDRFFNEPLDVAGLPRLEEEAFEPLDPNFLRVRWIADAIFAGIVVIAAVVLAFLVPWWIPLAIGFGLLIVTALVAWLQRLEVDHLGYLVRDKDFSFRSGVISRNITTVPFARIQHVSIDRGPLARYFGMATMQMRTAGDGLTVAGMNYETAAKLKALVVDRAGVLAEEEFGDGSAIDATGPTSDRAATSNPGHD
jgi:membrane protein YdbS with pleckstrin-like domain